MENLPFQMIRDIPPITRCWMGGMLIVSIAQHCGIFTPLDLVYSYEGVFVKHQYYRLISSFLFSSNMGFGVLPTLFYIYNFSASLENSYGPEWVAKWNYLWDIFLSGVFILLSSTFLVPHYVLGNRLIDSLTYLWSKQNQGVPVQIFRLIEFNSNLLPFFNLAESLLYGKSFTSVLVDLLVFHLFYYLRDVYPKFHGYNPLSPPWQSRAPTTF